MSGKLRSLSRADLRADHFLLACSLILVVLSAVLSRQTTRDLKTSTHEVARINRLIYANQALLSGLKDLESSQGGYLLTGERKYLKSFEDEAAMLPGLIENLAKELDQGAQRERYRELVALIAQERADLDQTIAVRDRSGAEAAFAIVRADRGRPNMDAIRALSSAIDTRARDTLISDVGALADRQSQSSLLALGITISLFLFLGLAVANIQRGVQRRDELIGDLDGARQQLQTTLSSIGDGVVVTDAHGNVTFINTVASQISGWGAKEAVGRRIEEVLPLLSEATRQPIDHPVNQVLRDKGPAQMADHTILLRADGTEVPVDDTAAPILSKDGIGLHGVIMVIRDITERRIAENLIQKWQHVFEHAGFGMAIFSPGDEPRLLQVNPAFLKMHGYQTADNLDGAFLSTVVCPDVWPQKVLSLRDAERTGHVLTQTVHIRKDGTRFPTLSDITVVRDEAGRALYGIAYYSDITERVNAEDELRRNEERFRTMADSLPQLVWTTLPDGTPDYFNSRWKEATGLDLAAAKSKGWHYFLHPDDGEKCLREWNAALKEETVFQTETRLGQPDHERWYLCRAIPVRGADGKVVRWFGSCTDIDEARQIAQALQVSRDELQRSNFDLEQFAYAASHDLQEPLRMVVIYAQLLLEEFGPSLEGRGETYLNFAVDGALRMETLIKGLLAYSRASGPVDAPQGRVSLTEAFHTAMAHLKLQIEEGRADITCQTLPDLNVPEVHMTLIFQNLIGNAVKYARRDRDPVVSVAASQRSGEWTFSVRDNGIGIDPQFHDQIFRVFRRLHGADYPGTGIGLALCQRLIERNGGRIWVESTTRPDAETGSTFCFTLPA